MERMILADPDGIEIKTLLYPKIDIEIGKADNSFELVFSRYDWQSIEEKSRVYIPGTEFGGLTRRMGTSTQFDTVSVGGYTWRGLMTRKVIEPEQGADYATDTGDLNAIIKRRVEAALPGLFRGVSDPVGVSVTWQYDRYCTLHDGLQKLLKSVGYKLDIQYIHEQSAGGYVQVQAVPIVDYSNEIELSTDSRLNYTVRTQSDGVNHLILLGKGELRDRLVRHLYVNAQGQIVDTQTYTGTDEITAVYDSPGAEEPDLIQGGRERLQELMNRDAFSMDIATLNLDVAVGDIVGGRDYLTGMYMAKPIGGKIYRFENGTESIEYILEDENQ